MLPAGSLDNFRVLRELPVGLPSEVLQHRPDILADEHALKADNASIGAARAAFFPSITLLANEGSASDEMTRLFKGGNTTWTFIPQLNLPIFHGGQLRGALASAKAGREIDLAQYEKDIQVAFREVSDALAVRTTVMRQLAAQQALTDATAQSFRLANARYLNGIDSFLAVLDAQRALYAAQQNLIGLKFERQNNLVTLYKAMGGGVFATDVALPGKGTS